MTALWLALGIVLGIGGLLFGSGPELIAAAFSFFMALVEQLVKDYQRNRSASLTLETTMYGRTRAYDDREKPA